MKIQIISAAALIAVSASAYAENTTRPEGGHPPQRPSMQERMKEVDSNGDGAISKAEFLAQAEKHFAKMDRNGDGLITEDERGAMQGKRKDKAGGERPAGKRPDGAGAKGEAFP